MTRSQRRVLLTAALASAATFSCLQPIDPFEEPGSDAGIDAGETSDGGAQDGGADDAGLDGGSEPDGGDIQDAGEELDGGDSTDAGNLQDAGVPSLTWQPMTGLGAAGSAGNGIHGSTAANVYLVGRNSANAPRVWHSEGTSWSAVSLPLLAPVKPLQDVFVFPTRSVFAAGDDVLVACASDCETGGAFADAFAFTSVSGALHAVCGDPATGTVYAFGHDPADSVETAVLFRHTGSWSARETVTGMQNVMDCHLRRTGEVFLAGRSRLGRFDGGTAAALNPVFPEEVDGLAEQFHSVWGAELTDGGYRLFAGATGGRIYVSDGVSAPTLAFQGPGVSPIVAISGVSADEAYALPQSSSEGALRFRAERGWEVLSERPAFDAASLWAADADTYFAGGTSSAGAAAAVTSPP